MRWFALSFTLFNIFVWVYSDNVNGSASFMTGFCLYFTIDEFEKSRRHRMALKTMSDVLLPTVSLPSRKWFRFNCTHQNTDSCKDCES